MPQIGQMNTLTVISQKEFGLFLDGGELGDILLPKRYVPADVEVGSSLEVFLYHDSEDRLIATTETPKAFVDQCACLTVIDVNKAGAFLDWGLSKDLLLPFSEQMKPVEMGMRYVVYVFSDEKTDRLFATTRLQDHLYQTADCYKAGEEVDLMIIGRTPMGYKAVVDGDCVGIIYYNEVSETLSVGQELKGYIKPLREDERLDITINPLPAQARDELCEKIMAFLQENDGFCPLTDKSSPDDLKRLFKTSKRNFKKAIGALYKQQAIVIKPDGLYLIKGND